MDKRGEIQIGVPIFGLIFTNMNVGHKMQWSVSIINDLQCYQPELVHLGSQSINIVAKLPRIDESTLVEKFALTFTVCPKFYVKV